jgi:predicted transcriptional regulator
MDEVKDNVNYIDESNFCINTEATVVDAAAQMRDKNISALIVVGGGENWGIITETDLSRKILAEELNPKETKVRFVITKSIVSIESNMSMMSAFLKMGSHQIRHIAVTEDEIIMGILSMKILSTTTQKNLEPRKRSWLSNRLLSTWENEHYEPFRRVVILGARGCYSFLSSSETIAKNSAINSLLLLPAFFSFSSSNKSS